jgi:hypothetical protein
MTARLRSTTDATILSATGLLVAMGLVLRCWDRIARVMA